MSPVCHSSIEAAVDRLLRRNAQLHDLCHQLMAEQEDWQQQRRELLAEIEGLLTDLERLQENCL